MGVTADHVGKESRNCDGEVSPEKKDFHKVTVAILCHDTFQHHRIRSYTAQGKQQRKFIFCVSGIL